MLISQNRLSAEAERRADLDLRVGMLTDHELTRVLKMLDAIQDKLCIANVGDSDLADLKKETQPEDVLAEIEQLNCGHSSEKSSREEQAPKTSR